MIEKFSSYLESMDFIKVTSNIPEVTLFFQIENNFVNVINLMDCREKVKFSIQNYDFIKDKIKELFEKKHYNNIHILNLIVAEDYELTRDIRQEDQFCWFIESAELKLMIEEHQAQDFYGMKRMIIEGLFQIKKDKFLQFPKKSENELLRRSSSNVIISDLSKRTGKSKNKIIKKIKKQYSFVSIFFVAINVLIFILCTQGVNLLYNKGTLLGPAIFENNQYYRLITAMFLHGDLNHLISNMMLLYFLGDLLEQKIGHIKFGVLYLLSGIGGGIASVGYEYASKEFIPSIGASGAIFGLMGVLLYLVICNKGKLNDITLPRIAIMIIYSIYSGLIGTNIDNAAHIGGLMSGIIISVILGVKISSKVKKS